MAQRLETGAIKVTEQTKKNADKSGSMIKQGGYWKNWKQRHFILKDAYLYYFALSTDMIPKGVIDLEGATIQTENQIGKKYCFSVKASKSWTGNIGWDERTYFFQTNSEEEMNSWMKALSNAANKQNNTTNSISGTQSSFIQTSSQLSGSQISPENKETYKENNHQNHSQTSDLSNPDELSVGSFEIKPDQSIMLVITIAPARFEYFKQQSQIHFISIIGILNSQNAFQIRVEIPDINCIIGFIGPFSNIEQQRLEEAQRAANLICLLLRSSDGKDQIDLSFKSGKGVTLDFSGNLFRAISYPLDNPSKEPLLREVINTAEEKKLPVPTGAYYELGRYYMAKANYELALEYLDKEIKILTSLNQHNLYISFPLNSKAVMYKRNGKIDLAKETFEKALLLRPNYFEALITYSTILAGSSQTMGRSFELVSRAMILQPDNAIFNQLLPSFVKIFSQYNESSLRKKFMEQGKKIDLSKPSITQTK